MSKNWRIILLFAAIGLVIAVVFFTYLELTILEERSSVVLFIGNVLCPPALLSVFLFDFDARSIMGFLGWSIIALLNAGLYAAIGTLVRRLAWKTDESPTS